MAYIYFKINTFKTILFITIINQIYTNKELDNFLLDIETQVKKISNAAELSFKSGNRCSEDNCSACSRTSCSKELAAELTCNTDYKSISCPNCTGVGYYTNTDFSSVHFVNNTATNINDNSISEIVCSTSQLDPIFIENHYENKTKWQYVGTYNGIFREFPAKIKCSNYDPRLRPWYIASSTGLKNVIIMIDNSASMGKDSNIIKALVKRIVMTLGMHDYIGIVTFNDEAKQYRPHLIASNQKNKGLIYTYIDELAFIQTTNYEKGFKSTYELLSNSIDDGQETGCRTIIMLLTDGFDEADKNDPIVGETKIPNLLTLINTLDKNYNAMFFTYAIGQKVANTFLLELSCDKKGISEVVPSEEHIEKAMNSYSTVLASGINRNNSNVIWTEPYTDYNGLGEMTTASFPIYDYSTTIPYLIGVAGVDILMSDIYSFGEKNYTSIITKLKGRSSGCDEISLNNCQLEYLRGNDSKCINLKYSTLDIFTDCQPIIKPLTCKISPAKFNNPICSIPVDSLDIDIPQMNNCCGVETCVSQGLSNHVIILLIIIVFGILVYFYWLLKKDHNPTMDPDDRESLNEDLTGKQTIKESIYSNKFDVRKKNKIKRHYDSDNIDDNSIEMQTKK